MAFVIDIDIYEMQLGFVPYTKLQYCKLRIKTPSLGYRCVQARNVFVVL